MIDMEPSVTIATTNIYPYEPKDLEIVEHLLHSHMWLKGTPLPLIIDSMNQKNMILVEVIKRLKLVTMRHLQPYNIGYIQARSKKTVLIKNATFFMASSLSR